MKLPDLKEQRAIKLAELRGLATKEEAAPLADNERARFDALESEVRQIDDRIRRAETLAEMERRAEAEPVSGEHNGTPDLSRYSVARAVRCALAGRVDGLEGEVSAELSRGREVRGNIMVPTTVLLGETRAQIVGSGPAGGYLVPTTLAAVADRFRPALKVEALGATVLRDLQGDIELPKLTDSGSASWTGETTNATRTSAAFGKLLMSARTCSAEYELSRRFMLQTGEAVESLLRRDLGSLLATALDRAAIKSSGAPVEPTGILDSGIELVATAAALGDTASDLIAALEFDNVSGTRAFLTSPKVLNAARKIKDGEGQYIPLADTFHRERLESTTQCPDDIGAGSNKSALICGVWSELVIGYWSGVDILVNPYHSDVASKGGALLHAFLDADVAVRHVEAFSYAAI